VIDAGPMVPAGPADEWVAAEGPPGPVFAAYNPRGVSFVTATEDPGVFTERFLSHFDRPLRPAARPPSALLRALETGRTPRSLRVDLRGLSPFFRTVLERTREIPYGEVRSYAWVAREAGRPTAVRAAGSALARNPVPFLVPCHRVVRSDGTVGHYGFGPGLKRAILTAEGVDLDELEALGRAGTQVVAGTSTGVYCVPSCRAARRITPPRRVAFPSPAAAEVQGYRPCRLCHPA
jgi:O-6-methylguanine DNA methyltransferase